MSEHDSASQAEQPPKAPGLHVRVADLQPEPAPLGLVGDETWWTRARSLFLDPESRLLEPFRLDLEAYRLGRRLLFRGRVQGQVELRCSRCADPFAFRFDAQLELLLEPFPETGEPRQPGIELDGEELELGRYAGEELDFEPVLRDHLLLSWPMAPCCAEGCLGLCPVCGENLNREACQCDPDRGNKPFAGLGDLLARSRTRDG
ncbi:MAG: DUF177 domain-containing protein [Deltaproteobacteria bacterium]|nr:DUF177 domain-containing protein [Deltaproteobacteria bacterium]MBW2414240.1 DUF177 domain-containing protein [Deltaproteobacteria bacterium]